MPCLMTILSVTADPLTGDLHIYGSCQGCTDPKIRITVTCGSQTYSGGAAVNAAGTWSAVVPATSCGCGQPITVVAANSFDPTCNTTFTTNILCCCPQIISSTIYGLCSGSSQLVTFDTNVSIGAACTFTLRRDFGDGTFGNQYTLTGAGIFNLPQEQHSYAAPNTYTSTVDVLSPAGCGSLDPVNVVVQCGMCHTSNFKAAWCQFLEFLFLLSTSVALVLTLANPCTPPVVALSFGGTAIAALVLFLLLQCKKCVCDPVTKFIGQIFLITGIILFMFIPPNCSSIVGGIALAGALAFGGLGFLYLNGWYSNNRSTCPLIICDLWCTVGGLLNPRACTNLAIVGALIVWALTGSTLTLGLGISLFVAVIIGFLVNGPLTTAPCNNTTRTCQ